MESIANRSSLLEKSAALPKPADLFAGIRMEEGCLPDNIVLFRRTERSELMPEGVSHNFHHRFELLIVLENGGPVRVGNQRYLLEPNQATLVFPNQFHYYSEIDSKSLNWLFITFDCLHAETLEPLKNRPRIMTEKSRSLLASLLEIAQPDRSQEGNHGLAISYHLLELLQMLIQASPIPQDHFSHPNPEDNTANLVEIVNNYVRNHLDQPIKIPDLAKAIGYSDSYLRSMFKESFGVSLGRYLRESRLSRASQLLRDSNLRVRDIAEICGFESKEVFSRSFKKTFGVSPKKFSLQR